MPDGYMPTSDGGRIVGKLMVFHDIHWRTKQPRLEIHMAGTKSIAHLEVGALGNPTLSFSVGADRVFRTEVQNQLNKLKTLLILGG